eukprot:TRINITY_DN47477_c0_g1_i1.p1 TRINITY_DN47477_c0_g1~~TRINITY_DN47477_c0_g1_i1.p1  ORF type:complete len:461 (+),score=136.17 TRINITY_DN47477_c0_g1_i1:89-1471(+)
MRCGTFLALAAVAAAAALYWPLSLRARYVVGGLAPRGAGPLKDVAAYLLLLLPRLQRLRPDPRTEEQRYAAAEGFHDALEFNNVGGGNKMRDSPYFAENFYFWVAPPNSEDLLFTVRLSFAGVGGAHIVPWFTFMADGDEWSLPAEFEQKALPHPEGSPEVACECPGLGKVTFTCEVPMRRWRLKYTGTVEAKGGKRRRQVAVELVLHFTPKNVFLYQVHWDEMAAARALSAKDWDGTFWHNLRAQYQERYMSQALRAEGTIAWDGGEPRQLPALLDGSRDHNFGIRNWRFIWRYIWWPGVKFQDPIRINGVEYRYFTGSFVEYGNTFENMVVGGLMSEEGDCAAFSGATPMREIAPEWYDAPPSPNVGIGERLIPGQLRFQISVLSATYVLDIDVERGSPAGLWSHSFMMQGGTFEIHEGLTRWRFALRAAGSDTVLQRSSALGLLEFGGNIAGVDDSD